MEKPIENVIDIINNDSRTDVNVEITITNSCNCNCVYCFECSHDNTSSKDEEDRQLKIIKDYCDSFDRLKHRHLNIIFWGGEPMMNTDYLFKIIDETVHYDFVKYMMYSNGTLKQKYEEMVNKDFMKFLVGRFEVQLSYDGEPHNTIKRGTNKEIIFDVADLLISHGVQVTFKATLSMDSLSLLPQIWDSYKELHDRYDFVYYSPTLDQTDKDNTDENFEIWKDVLKQVAAKEIKFIRQYGRPLWVWFERPGKLACDINNSIHIHCDGNLYLCHGCQYQNNPDKFIVGTTREISNLENALISGFRPTVRHIDCVNCSAVVCSVCHVNELAKCPTLMNNYKDNWTRVMVNNPKRCRFFKQFGKIYYATTIAIMESDR